MNRLTKLPVFVCLSIFLLALCYPTFAERDSQPNKAFLMEIAVSGRPSFLMPVNTDEKKIAVVPMSGITASAVKVMPTVKGNSLHFELSAVVDKLPETLSCDNIKTLKTEMVTSFSAGEGSVVRVLDFEKFGIGSFTVKITPLLLQQERVCPNGACCCGVNTCYPNPGACIECGSCGTCCRVQ